MKSKSKQEQGIGATVILGSVLAVVITLVISGVVATMLNKEMIDTSPISIIAIITQFVSTLVSGLQTCKRASNVTLACIATAMVYFLFMLVLALIVFDGEFHNLVSGFLATAFGAVSAILLGRKKQSVKRLRRKM